MEKHEQDKLRAGLNKALEKSDFDSLNAWAKASKVSESTVRMFLKKQTNSLRTSTLDRLAKALNVTSDYFLTTTDKQTTPVVGYVGAGAVVHTYFDDYAMGDGMEEIDSPGFIQSRAVEHIINEDGTSKFEQIPAPIGVSGETFIALKVTGDSMEPAYREGDYVYYNADNDFSPECLGRDCVVQTDEDVTYLKRLKVSSKPGLYDLLSLNPQYPDMLGVRIKRAARVRHVMKG